MLWGHHCRHCGAYWASQAKPDDFIVITVLCPSCISAIPLAHPPWSLARSA